MLACLLRPWVSSATWARTKGVTAAPLMLGLIREPGGLRDGGFGLGARQLVLGGDRDGDQLAALQAE